MAARLLFVKRIADARDRFVRYKSSALVAPLLRAILRYQARLKTVYARSDPGHDVRIQSICRLWRPHD